MAASRGVMRAVSVTRLAEIVDTRGITLVEDVHDADEFAEIATRVTRPHTILPRSPDARLDARLTALPLGDIAVSRVTYGADVSVIPGDDEPDSFLFPLSMAGTARLRYGNESVPIASSDTTVIAPYREFRSDIDADYEQVLVAVSRSRIERVAASLLLGDVGDVLDMPLTTFDLPDAVLRMLEALALLVDETGPLGDPDLRNRLQDVALESLLLSVPSFRERLPARGDVRSARVRAAMEYMLDRVSEPVSFAAVAAAVGVSPRGLQLAFRKAVGTTPSAWLRTKRLERAHRMLTAADPASTTVTSIANACGFFHPGEFAGHFRAAYGIAPSALLGRPASCIRS